MVMSIEGECFCTIKTNSGQLCQNKAQHVVMRNGVKVSPMTNLRGHVHTACNMHLDKALALLSLNTTK